MSPSQNKALTDQKAAERPPSHPASNAARSGVSRGSAAPNGGASTALPPKPDQGGVKRTNSYVAKHIQSRGGMNAPQNAYGTTDASGNPTSKTPIASKSM